MNLFPKIQSPCPLKADLAAYMDGDQCRMCKRQVVDISRFTDGEQAAFFAGCATEVCVSYRLPKAAIGAAIALAAAAAPMAAAAQEVPAVPGEIVVVADGSPADTGADAEDVDVVVVGGITDPKAVAYVDQDGEDAAAPELPVTYEDADGAAAPSPGGA